MVFFMALALFDLDHTLLDGDSNSLWLLYLIDRGYLDAEVWASQATYLEQYANEALDIVEHLEFHLGILRTRSLKEWLPIRDAFIAERISPRLPTAAISSVKEHRARGDDTAIITATHSILAQGIGFTYRQQNPVQTNRTSSCRPGLSRGGSRQSDR